MAAEKIKQKRMTAAELRVEYEKLKDLLEDSARCGMCDKLKKKEKFYYNSDPRMKGGFTFICKDCARKIALKVGDDGEEQEPDKESITEAMEYLDKPMLNVIWDASVQESENLVTGKKKNNVWTSLIKNAQMKQYLGLRFHDSDMFNNQKQSKSKKQKNPSVNKMLKDHEGQDTYDSFQKNKADVIRLLDYDPFEQELISDQPFLYAQLLALLDSSEDANEDMIRTSSAISIARDFLQASKLDDSIAKLMTDSEHLKDNAATIKSLQDSKSKVMSMITSLAAESCLSLKNSKTSTKAENSFTGKLAKLKNIGLRDSETNGFDIETCKGMQQVANISMKAIIDRLNMDESEWAEIVKEQRQELSKAILKAKNSEEAFRILLRENLDLRSTLESNDLLKTEDLMDLDELLNTYITNDEEVTSKEKEDAE